jgi:hypothetical protein
MMMLFMRLSVIVHRPLALKRFQVLKAAEEVWEPLLVVLFFFLLCRIDVEHGWSKADCTQDIDVLRT